MSIHIHYRWLASCNPWGMSASACRVCVSVCVYGRMHMHACVRECALSLFCSLALSLLLLLSLSRSIYLSIYLYVKYMYHYVKYMYLYIRHPWVLGRTCMHICMSIYNVCIQIDMCVHTDRYLYIFALMYTSTYIVDSHIICMHIHTWIYTHICMCVYVCIFHEIYAYIYRCQDARLWNRAAAVRIGRCRCCK